MGLLGPLLGSLQNPFTSYRTSRERFRPNRRLPEMNPKSPERYIDEYLSPFPFNNLLSSCLLPTVVQTQGLQKTSLVGSSRPNHIPSDSYTQVSLHCNPSKCSQLPTVTEVVRDRDSYSSGQNLLPLRKWCGSLYRLVSTIYILFMFSSERGRK